eukprot:1508478-Rhodomonas_salina.2
MRAAHLGGALLRYAATRCGAMALPGNSHRTSPTPDMGCGRMVPDSAYGGTKQRVGWYRTVRMAVPNSA